MAAPLYELCGATRYFELGSATIKAVDGVDLNLDAEEFVAIDELRASVDHYERLVRSLLQS